MCIRDSYTPVMGNDFTMDYLGKTGLDAAKGADIINEAPKLYSSKVEYPNTNIGKQLKGVAQVHFAGFGTRIFMAAVIRCSRSIL